jgi:hypothetical protein
MLEALKAFAAQMGWPVSPKPGALARLSGAVTAGEEAGFPVQLKSSPKGGVLTTILALPESLAVPFVIADQTGIELLGGLVHFHDLQIGDPLIDDLVFIKAKDDAWMRRLLTPEVCGALIPLCAAKRHFTISDFHITEDGIAVESRLGDDVSEEEVRSIVAMCVEMLRALDASRPH